MSKRMGRMPNADILVVDGTASCKLSSAAWFKTSRTSRRRVGALFFYRYNR